MTTIQQNLCLQEGERMGLEMGKVIQPEVSGLALEGKKRNSLIPRKWIIIIIIIIIIILAIILIMMLIMIMIVRMTIIIIILLKSINKIGAPE